MLAACPRCDYPLTGLPDEHACPECGLRYDRATVVYRPVRLITPFHGGVGFLGAFLYVAMVSSRLQNGTPRAFQIILLLIATAMIILVTCGVWYYHGLAKGKRLVAILPDMLLIRLTAGEPKEIAWSNISRVSGNRGNMAVSIFVRDRRTVETVGGIFRSKSESQQFADRAMARIFGIPQDKVPSAIASAATGEPDPHATTIPLKAFREAEPRWYALPIAAATALALIIAPVPRVIRVCLFVILGVAALIAEIVLAVRTPKQPQSLTMDRNGVILRRGEEELVRLPWAEVSGAACTRPTGQFRITGHGGEFLFVCSYTELGSFKAVKHVANEVVRLRFAYSQVA